MPGFTIDVRRVETFRRFDPSAEDMTPSKEEVEKMWRDVSAHSSKRIEHWENEQARSREALNDAIVRGRW